MDSEGAVGATYQNCDDFELDWENAKREHFSRKYVTLFSLFVGFVCVGLFVSSHNLDHGERSKINLSSKSNDDDKNDITWTLYNRNYGPIASMVNKSTFLKYTFLQNYDSVIEPGASMTVYFSDPSYEHFEVTLCASNGKEKDNCAKSDGEIIQNCQPFDEFDVKIYAKQKSEYGGTKVVSGGAVCMYVRREIRQLVAEDLNATMNAMAAIWYTDSEMQGQSLYGANFHTHTYFASAHYFGSAGLDADYTHGGHGFLPQHAKLSNVFELAMQAVDSKVTLPYWDYTIDADYEMLSDAFVFQPDVFGTLVNPNNSQGYWLYKSNQIEDGIIPDGRWANLKVDLNSDYCTENVVATSPYGFLRAPWAANPSKHVLRFPIGAHTVISGLPGCTKFYEWMDEYDTLSDLMREADVGPHTKAHWAIGSMFGCDVLDDLSESYPAFQFATVSDSYNLCAEWGIYIKSYFRDGYLKTNTNCTASIDLDRTNCAWSCDESKSDEFVSKLKSSLKTHFQSYSSLTDSDWADMQTFFCSGPAFKLFYGDHREPGSASDPSFWPIHPALDRVG